jgi:CubicO group peptidase (beta-lactamase class C family)
LYPFAVNAGKGYKNLLNTRRMNSYVFSTFQLTYNLTERTEGGMIWIFRRKRVLWVLAVLAVLILLTTAVWMVIAGPETVGRILRYGDTKIDDYLHYPYREMSADPSPFALVESGNRAEVKIDVPVPSGSTTDLDDLLEGNDTIAFLILKNDRLVVERYYQGHAPSSISQSFSMAKSFTSILIGQAIDDGYIHSVDQPITDFIPELSDSGFSPVTIRHLLSMTSGSSYIENDNPFGIHVILNYTPTLEQKILEFRMRDEPGTVWRYKSGDNALLGLALSRAIAPKTISEYTYERLWSPLGMEYRGLWSLDHDGGGLEKTWCCLSAAARDYLKLGRLYLNEGVWEGEQIVPADWVRESAQQGAVPEANWDSAFRRIGVWNYGYQWWLVSRQDGSYLANGKDGQYLYINPAKDTVILRLGWSMGDLPLSQWLILFNHLAEQNELFTSQLFDE